MIEKYTKFSMQLSYTKGSICDPKTTKIEDEAKFVVVDSTTQQASINHFKKESKIYCPSDTLWLLQIVLTVCSIRQSIHGLVLLAKSSKSRQPYPQSGFTYSLSKGARRLIFLETLVLKVSASTLLLSRSREILD